MSAQTTDCLLVFTNFPNEDIARQIGAVLVENQLAACVNLLGPATSIYSWKGKIETETEIPALIKTTEAAFQQLLAKLTALHPYETPEIIATPIAAGSNAYLNWIRKNVAEESAGKDV